jgi:hypothetical protein
MNPEATLPDADDMVGVAQFVGACVDAFCRAAEPGAFARFRFESALRAYEQHLRVGAQGHAAPLRREAMSILDEALACRQRLDEAANA